MNIQTAIFLEEVSQKLIFFITSKFPQTILLLYHLRSNIQYFYSAIESGLATIRRKPSQSPLRRLNGPVSAPIPPVAPMPGTIPVRVPVPSPLCLSAKPPPPPVPISARPPLPNKPKRNGSTLSHEFQS